VQRWEIRKEEAIVIPKLKFFLVWLVFAVTIIVMLFQGAKGTESVIGIEKCGAADWIIFG